MRTRRAACIAGVLMTTILLPAGVPAKDDDDDIGARGMVRQPAVFVVPEAPPEATNEARRGKQILGLLVQNDPRHAEDLGFTSVAEAADGKTELEAPFPIVRIDFGKLVAFTKSSDPATLLMPTGEFFYPVSVGGTVRSSLRVRKVRPNPQTGKEWRTIDWGISVIRLLDQTKKIAGTSNSSFAVWIPELNRYFLGDIQNGKHLIIPLVNEPRSDLQFKAHTPLPAEEVFERLVPEAKKRPAGAG
jgi:hypothetical protein